MKLLAIIPARKGSKGVPRKNIALLNNSPLICHTLGPAIEALQLNKIAKVIVSTDDDELTEIVEMRFGSKYCQVRPGNLAHDQAKTIDVVLYVLEKESEKGNEYDGVILLQPTSPLRELTDILSAIQLFENCGRPALISAYCDSSLSEGILYKHVDNLAIPIASGHNKGVRRQEESPILIRNGSIYITRTDYLISSQQFFDDSPVVFVMPKSKSINIDRPCDLEDAERYLKLQKN